MSLPSLALPAAPITTLTAVTLALVYVRLALGVIKLRRQHGVKLGTGTQPDLEAAVRAHANFAEYVPLVLILLLLAEINQAMWPITAVAAILLIYGRLTHARALQSNSIPQRVTGMKATFAAIAVGMLANLAAFVSAPAFAADPLRVASGAELRKSLSGNTVEGSMEATGRYSEFYAPDGTVRSKDYRARWSVEGDAMCWVYDGAPKDCWQAAIKGAQLHWIKGGKRLGSGTLLPGNPNRY